MVARHPAHPPTHTLPYPHTHRPRQTPFFPPVRYRQAISSSPRPAAPLLSLPSQASSSIDSVSFDLELPPAASSPGIPRRASLAPCPTYRVPAAAPSRWPRQHAPHPPLHLTNSRHPHLEPSVPLLPLPRRRPFLLPSRAGPLPAHRPHQTALHIHDDQAGRRRLSDSVGLRAVPPRHQPPVAANSRRERNESWPNEYLRPRGGQGQQPTMPSGTLSSTRRSERGASPRCTLAVTRLAPSRAARSSHLP